MRIQLRPISRDTLFEYIGLRISYEPTNHTAERLYAQIGFRPTGEIKENEVIAQFQTEP